MRRERERDEMGNRKAVCERMGRRGNSGKVKEGGRGGKERERERERESGEKEGTEGTGKRETEREGEREWGEGGT